MTAAVTRDVPAAEGGVVQAIDAEALGLASLCLGAGRVRLEDEVAAEERLAEKGAA